MTSIFSGQQLKDSLNILSLITNTNKYKFFNFSNNNFTSLAQELSKFSNFIKLDFSGNKFNDIPKLINSFQALPLLQILNIDIYIQEDAYLILKNFTDFNSIKWINHLRRRI